MYISNISLFHIFFIVIKIYIVNVNKMSLLCALRYYNIAILVGLLHKTCFN